MNNRSTNARFVHFGGDVISNVESSHGVQLTGGSTGGTVQAFGDDTDISLNVVGKGAGAVVLGSATSPVTLSGGVNTVNSSISLIFSTATTIGTQGTLTIGSSAVTVNSTSFTLNSTTPIVAIQRYLVQWTVPALSSAASAESTVAVTGLTTNSILVLTPRQKLNSTVTGVAATCRCSTADELTIISHNISQSSLSGSTQSAYLLQFKF